MVKKINKFTEPVYFVESPKDSTVLLSINLQTDGRIIRWFDTIKWRIMGIEKIIDDNPKHFVFERLAKEGGGSYTFTPLTISLYNQKVKQRLLMPKKFTKKEEMIKEILNTIRTAW